MPAKFTQKNFSVYCCLMTISPLRSYFSFLFFLLFVSHLWTGDSFGFYVFVRNPPFKYCLNICYKIIVNLYQEVVFVKYLNIGIEILNGTFYTRIVEFLFRPKPECQRYIRCRSCKYFNEQVFKADLMPHSHQLNRFN